MTPIEILAKCFAALPAANRARLLRHERKRTPILCGKDGAGWVGGKAG